MKYKGKKYRIRRQSEKMKSGDLIATFKKGKGFSFEILRSKALIGTDVGWMLCWCPIKTKSEASND